MHLTLAYLGRSGLAPLPHLLGTDRGSGGSSAGRGAQALNLVPNLQREAVAFDAALLHPLRFREAMSALHDIVTSDLRFQKRDKAAYEAYKQAEKTRLDALRRDAMKQVRQEILSRQEVPVPPDLEHRFHNARKQYWGARQKYANDLLANDPALWRLLMPCDPVVTVAEDVVFFECFSADESSYGCLSVSRPDGFGRSDLVQLGTTNVDYSWELYHHFQSLRSYRETRLRVDPAGFEVATTQQPGYREEKIDLPPSWLRGFLQIQAAMGLPMRKVSLSREAVYSILAWQKRHKARSSPRALRFELQPGRDPELVLEPWEQRIVSRGTPYVGPPGAPIRVWGQRRLLSLARVLPLAEGFDVYLLGTGLPSFWVARMGEMRLTLGLSGWTTNDWSRGGALDLLAPPETPTADLVGRVARTLQARKAATLTELTNAVLAEKGKVAAALDRLAHQGQTIYDLNSQVFRWRSILPAPVAAEQLGPENPELIGSRELLEGRALHIESRQQAPDGGTLVSASLRHGYASPRNIEVLLDRDGVIRRGQCNCSHHFKSGLRQGPCRHLLALRTLALKPPEEATAKSTGSWYERLLQWSSN